MVANKNELLPNLEPLLCHSLHWDIVVLGKDRQFQNELHILLSIPGSVPPGAGVTTEKNIQRCFQVRRDWNGLRKTKMWWF